MAQSSVCVCTCEKETKERMKAMAQKKTLKFHRSQDLLFQSNFLLVELFSPLKMH